MKIRLFAFLAVLVLLLSSAACAEENEGDVFTASNHNDTALLNGPSFYPVFTTDRGDVLLLSVTTYHWNNGEGSLPGEISVCDLATGTVLGTWQAVTLYVEKDYTWAVYPEIILESGKSYYFIDSDPDTWSRNGASLDTGFAEITGSGSYGDAAQIVNGLKSVGDAPAAVSPDAPAADLQPEAADTLPPEEQPADEQPSAGQQEDASSAGTETVRMMKTGRNDVNVRAETSKASKKVEMIRKKGTEVTVLGEEKDASGTVWFRVRTPDGKEGYIRSDLLVP